MLKGIAIGCGFISKKHLQAWDRIENARILATVDIDEEKARQKAQEFNIPSVYTSLEQAFEKEKPDFVDIMTRPDSHLSLTRTAAAAGCHILCQKPLASTVAEAEEIIATAEHGGVRIMVSEMWRWIPHIREVKKLIDKEITGRPIICHLVDTVYYLPRTEPVDEHQPYLKDWPRLCTYDMGIHYIDSMRSYFGDVTSVYAVHRKVNPVLKGEDVAAVTLIHESGVASVLNYLWCVPHDKNSPHIRVTGENGVIELANDQRTIYVYPLQKEAYRHEYAAQPGCPDDSVLSGFIHCLNDFAQGLATGRDFISSGRNNLNTFKATMACYESAKKGEVVRLQGESENRTDNSAELRLSRSTARSEI